MERNASRLRLLRRRIPLYYPHPIQVSVDSPMLAAFEERWAMPLPRLVTYLLVGCTVLLLSLLGWRWWSAMTAPARLAIDTGQSGIAQDAVLPTLLNANLFGNAAPLSGSQPGNVAPMQTSRGGYTLRAALAPSGEARGGAIIESSDGEAHWYAVKANVPGAGQLQEVHPSYVVLNRNGALERLDFPVFASAADENPPVLAVKAPTSEVAPATDAVNAGPIPANLAHEEKARLIRQRLEELRNRSRT
jgi:type II secretory pathway component PulC